ncbi:MAG: DUF1844 domain-containing protein [Verrucomicrobia bacterium]|nr:DUF1844 domain-containing protein [Verrucomicrobiota bacterium]
MMNPSASASRNETLSAHFASMVMQNAQMALMLLGQVPHPETGQTVTDLEGARMFIDQLEMLEVKTKGNLTKEEEQLLKQSLVGTRMAFVAATQQQEKAAPPVSDSSAAASVPPAPALETPDAPAPLDDESRKKFSKKY